MQEHDTLQAVMRFGRDGNGAVVYVHTNTLPEWVPLVGAGRVLTTRSEGERQVLDVIEDREEWTTADLAEHPDVDIGERQVLNVLTKLTEDGYLRAETKGRGYVWRGDGIHRVNEFGEVELESVDLDSLSDNEVDEITRNSVYTWNFVNYAGSSAIKATCSAGGDGVLPNRIPSRGEPPPDDTT